MPVPIEAPASGRTLRAFVAAELPEAIRLELASTAAALAVRLPGARPVRAGSLHLTLRFLGDVPEAASETIASALSAALVGCRAFTVELRGVGAFPDLRRPRVLWAGVSDPVRLEELAERIRAATADVPTADDLPFRPHVTIARMRNRREAGAPRRACGPQRGEGPDTSLAGHDGRRFGGVAIDEVVLVESQLRGAAPVYHVRARLPLERR